VRGEGRGGDKGRKSVFFYEIVGDTGIYINFKVRPQLGDFFRTRVETQHFRGDNEGDEIYTKTS